MITQVSTYAHISNWNFNADPIWVGIPEEKFSDTMIAGGFWAKASDSKILVVKGISESPLEFDSIAKHQPF